MPRDIEALLGYLADRAAMPYAPGSEANDCVSFAAGAVRAQSGEDLIEGLSWTTDRGARRVLAGEGGLEAAVDRRRRRIAPARALRGDIAGVTDERLGISLAIVEGATLAAPGEHGLLRLPRSAMIAAWSAVEPPEPAHV